jgi:predicted transcriptional regulator of viral defense system
MKATDAYADLRRLGIPVVATREAAARLGLALPATSRLLGRLAGAGLVRPVRRGLWALHLGLDPFALPAYVAAPYPAYVSLWSALARHGMIEQLPRELHAVTLGRTRVVSTGFGPLSMHHVSPPLFGGFATTNRGYQLATPEKALFDTLYTAAPSGGEGRLPELELPPGFEDASVAAWLEQIDSGRLRTLVARSLRRALRHARRG